LARSRCYKPENPPETAFVFGAKLNVDGMTYVGSGDDNDPFIVGVTSLAIFDSCIRFSTGDARVLFHADATFKLSDIGYPVITCGFTDQARRYQVGAFFVVSRRAEHEYTECFRAFVELVRSLRGISIRCDFTMSDAEDSQFLALQNVPTFQHATKLMCFFHVLYNVRKRTQHLPLDDRKKLMIAIMDMHFSRSLTEYEYCRDVSLAEWKETTHLTEFAEYFDQQWLKGRYWRWQVFHTPEGYATTTNPCENLNGGLK
ncbi:hypothetical protein PHYSODRAFT_421690, partial [Phytophthora sojae]